jgi:hypothetical protein
MPRRALYTEQQVREAVASAYSLTDALRTLGLRPAGGNHRTLRKLIERYGLSTGHFDPSRGRRGANRAVARPLDQVLVSNSTYSRGTLKNRLYDAGLKDRRCELCGQDETWRGKAMSLILDHINGIGDDNRLENLRIVCPNCAATLDTHCGRNSRLDLAPRACLRCGRDFVPKLAGQRYCSRVCGIHHKGRPGEQRPWRRKVVWPSYDQLRAELAATSFVAVGRKYGVSDNAVRKWLRVYEQQRNGEDRHEAA